MDFDDMTYTTGCIYTERDPAQTFCSCGKPIELYSVPYGHTALPILWIENGCDSCKAKYEHTSTNGGLHG